MVGGLNPEIADWKLAAPPAPRELSSSPPSQGLCVGPYRLIQRLGSGGGGEVFRAVDQRSSSVVALKTLVGARSGDPRYVQELLEEGFTADSIRHPGIVSIVEWGQIDDGTPFIAMEMLEGQPLDVRLARGRLQPREVVLILDGLLEALEAVHAGGVVHRDLKPSNIFLSVDEAGGAEVKLVDFGLAVHRRSSPAREQRVSGTPAYMAPERMRGHRGDARSDLFAVGAVAYEMLSGKAPFGHEPGAIALSMKRLLPPADPAQPRLSGWVSRLLSYGPLFRPSSAASARRKLASLAASMAH